MKLDTLKSLAQTANKLAENGGSAPGRTIANIPGTLNMMRRNGFVLYAFGDGEVDIHLTPKGRQQLCKPARAAASANTPEPA